MFKKVIIFCWFVLFGMTSHGQCPTANFSVPGSACLNEQLYPVNTSVGGISYSWDFCSGDFELTPAIESIGSSASLNRGRSFRLANISNGDWVGFAIDQASNRLVRFEFGNSPQNNPTIINIGNPDGILSGAYDFDIIQEANEWYIVAVNATTNDLVRISFGTDILNDTPTTTNLGDFSILNTPNNLTIVNELENTFMFISNGGNSSITRLEFGNSILNNPTSNSFIITGINNPRGIDIIKDCDRWVGLVTSYSSNKVFYMDFDNGLSQDPVSGEIAFYTSYNFPAALSIIHEGGQYYSLIQSALGDLYKLSFGTSISDFSGTGQNLGDFGLNSNFANEWINEESNWYGFSIELSNPSTPGAGNLIRYTFPTACGAIPSVSHEANPNFEYLTNGNHQVTLVSKNSNNDINAVNQSITISSFIAPQLSALITGNCLSSPISFDGQEISGSINSWNWDFGDGFGVSALQNDTYAYATAGTYQVKLSVTDANGCNNLYIDTAIVYEEPVPNFSVPPGNLCMNNQVSFTNTSTGETGPAVSWTWDFNGEGSSSDKEPSFTFLTSGSKTITLTSSILGCANVTQQTINIEEAPTTAFSFDNVCNSQTTTFTDLTTGINLTSWNWDFGDSFNSTDQNPTHDYALPGKYVVTLTVDNNLGCSTTKVDTVYNHAIPVASFTNELACSSSPIQFSDQSIVQDANIVAWEWNFGDGSTSTDRNPHYLYGQTGDFIVQLKSYSQFGCVDSVETTISVMQGPEVDFTWDKGCAGEPTTITDMTNSFGIPIIGWTWLIDGTIINEQNPQYSFSTSGIYTVQLSVTTSNLCAQSISKEIDIEMPPNTSFVYYESCTDDLVTFVDTTPTAIATREWRIDGIVQEGDSIMEKSLTPDNYEITLAATSSVGCTNTILQNIEITSSLTAEFKASTNYGALPLSVQFTNQSSGSNSYFWQLGAPNDTSIAENPQFTFAEIGSYEVSLIVHGGENCSDTTTQTIEVVEPNHDVSIDMLTPLEAGKVAVTMSNLGSVTYNETNCLLVFTLDNGAEITEEFNTEFYPLETINYVPDISLGESGNSKVLCVSLQYIDDPIIGLLDKNCLNLSGHAVIAEAFPNPASDYINLSVVLPTPGGIKIILIDRNGAVLLNESYNSAVQGLNDYSIDITPYRSGLYIIKIETENEVKKMKVVIDR